MIQQQLSEVDTVIAGVQEDLGKYGVSGVLRERPSWTHMKFAPLLEPKWGWLQGGQCPLPALFAVATAIPAGQYESEPYW